MTLRLTIAPGDHFDFEIKPFSEYTVADYMRIMDSPVDETLNPFERRCADLIRHTDAPLRFVRSMSLEQVDEALAVIDQVTKEKDGAQHALHKVHETLASWAEEHDGQEWNYLDAQNILQDLGVFKERIEVGGKVYTAPLVEPSSFGKWIDLQAAMDAEQTETESYVRACAIMVEGDDGPYPVQGEHQSDAHYAEQCDAYTQERRRLLTEARWVDVMGCAAFFFSKWPRFAEVTGHNMPNLNRLLSPKTKRTRMDFPDVGALMQS